MLVADPQAAAGFGGYATRDAMQMQANMAEQRELDLALQASRDMVHAEEEEMLRLALEESAKMAEEEKKREKIELQSADEIRAFYDQQAAKKKTDSQQSTADSGSVAVPYDSEEEGFAWDSDGEKDQEESD